WGARAAPGGASLAVIGLGPIGEMCTRVAQHLGVETVIGLDLVPERLARSAAHGVHTIDVTGGDDVLEAVRALTGRRGPDGVIDAVGMEAHGAPLGRLPPAHPGVLPRALAAPGLATAL